MKSGKSSKRGIKTKALFSICGCGITRFGALTEISSKKRMSISSVLGPFAISFSLFLPLIASIFCISSKRKHSNTTQVSTYIKDII